MAVLEMTVAEISDYEGKEIGVSGWVEVTQDQVKLFADATDDHQWIHVDPERAAAESPFGGPIAHGYLTLSLIPRLLKDVWAVNDAVMAVNYGLNRVRFPAPVLVGIRVRGRATMQSVKLITKGVQLILNVTIEIENSAKPACIAEVVFRVFG